MGSVALGGQSEGEAAPADDGYALRQEGIDLTAQRESLEELIEAWPKSVSCAECETALCESHAEANRASLEQLTAQWADWGAKERFEGLVQLAQQSGQHFNRQDPRVEEFLWEKALQAEAWWVRSGAWYALANQPEISRNLDRMMGQVERLRAQMEEVRGQLKEQSEKDKVSLDRGSALGPGGGQVTGDDILRLQRWLEAQERLRPFQFAVHRAEWEWGALLYALGTVPAKQTTDFLLDECREYRDVPLPDALVEALLRAPSQKRMRVCIDRFKAIEEQVKEWDQGIKKLERMKAPRTPKDYTGGTPNWERAFERVKERQLKAAFENRERVADQLVDYDRRLRTWAESLGLEPPPKEGRSQRTLWSNWMRRNKQSFPNAHGAMESGS